MVSELVVVRNLPYSLAEVSFLSLDSACRSPVALFILFLSFFFRTWALRIWLRLFLGVTFRRCRWTLQALFQLRFLPSSNFLNSDRAEQFRLCIPFRDGRCRWVWCSCDVLWFELLAITAGHRALTARVIIVPDDGYRRRTRLF